MSLARDVAARLEAEGVGFALIGAVAMAVHGVSRSTADIDFFSVDVPTLSAIVRSLYQGLPDHTRRLRALV